MALRRLARPLLGATSASELPRVAVAGFWSSSSLRSPSTTERLVDVTAIDPEGVRHNIKGLAGKTLLQVHSGCSCPRPQTIAFMEGCRVCCVRVLRHRCHVVAGRGLLFEAYACIRSPCRLSSAARWSPRTGTHWRSWAHAQATVKVIRPA